MEVITRKGGFLRWLCLRRVAVKVAYGYRRGKMGGDGGVLRMSCAFCWPHPNGGPVESEIRPSLSLKSSPTMLVEAWVSRVCSKVRTFAEILKSKP